MNLPNNVELTLNEDCGWHQSQPLKLEILNGSECRIIVEGYEEDPNKSELQAAISNFISSPFYVLAKAESYIFSYYQDIKSNWPPSFGELPTIEAPNDVWKFIQFGSEAFVLRRQKDNAVYISLECNCDWEQEHGLLIVFKNGQDVSKVGPFDGHLTNSDAYANPSLENVVYR